MTALVRRFDCGHTEFTGEHSKSDSSFAGVHLGTSGPCQQCIADGAKRLLLLQSEIGPMNLDVFEQEPMTHEEMHQIAERIKAWRPKP